MKSMKYNPGDAECSQPWRIMSIERFLNNVKLLFNFIIINKFVKTEYLDGVYLFTCLFIYSVS